MTRLKPIPDGPLYGVVTDEQKAALAARNEERLKAAQLALGDRWLIARPLPLLPMQQQRRAA